MTNTGGHSSRQVQAGFARIAALLADPAREAMLVALSDGRALPAGELAELAGVTPQSASGHLGKLVEGGVLSVWAQGRFRYYRLANADVAAAIEALSLAANTTPKAKKRPPPERLAAARSCYNHLAGRLGVAMADRLLELGYVRAAADGALRLSPDGAAWASGGGIGGLRTGQFLVRPCLDWSERRFHFAGPFATRLLEQLLSERRLLRRPDRSLELTAAGAGWFRELGLDAAAIMARDVPAPAPIASKTQLSSRSG
jgi:DNA-binding transcriptional ArsR family regulator